MSERRALVLLIICVGILFFVLLKMPNSPKESNDSSLKDSMTKFVKSIGDIQARLQDIEQKLTKIEKQPVQTRIDQSLPKEAAKEQEPVVVNQVDDEDQQSNSKNIPGEIKQANYCLDSAEQGVENNVILFKCHGLGRNQFFELKDGKILHKGLCLSVERAESQANIVMKQCNNQDVIQEWSYHDKYFKLGESKFCMTKNDENVLLEQCRVSGENQIWSYQQ